MRAAVIGAGASGMTAALTAARLGHEVRLFEQQARSGASSWPRATAAVISRILRRGLGTITARPRTLCAPRWRASARRRPWTSSAASACSPGGVRRQGLPAVELRQQRRGRAASGAEAAGVALTAGDRVSELRRSGSGFALATESGERF